MVWQLIWMGASGSCCPNVRLSLQLNIRGSNSRRAARQWWESMDHGVAEKGGQKALKWRCNSGAEKYEAPIHNLPWTSVEHSRSTFKLSVGPISKFPWHRAQVFIITCHMLYYNYWFTCLFLPQDWSQDHDIAFCVPRTYCWTAWETQ